MPAMIRLLFAACFFAITTAHAQQIILLKLDDVIARRVGTKPVSDRWQKVRELPHRAGHQGLLWRHHRVARKGQRDVFSVAEGRASRRTHRTLDHGYKMRGTSDTGEFPKTAPQPSNARSCPLERLARGRLDFTLPAFGPHWSGTTDATDED